MNTHNTKVRYGGAGLGEREALHEMLVASLTLAFQIGDTDTGDCLMEAIRTLHRNDEVEAEAINAELGDAGFE